MLMIVSFKCLFFSKPPSRNRRERAELRPDFFDSAAMIEDESVRIIKSIYCFSRTEELSDLSLFLCVQGFTMPMF